MTLVFYVPLDSLLKGVEFSKNERDNPNLIDDVFTRIHFLCFPPLLPQVGRGLTVSSCMHILCFIPPIGSGGTNRLSQVANYTIAHGPEKRIDIEFNSLI